jgi:hypothetical protein
MLEDWLNNPELVDDYHENTFIQIVGDEHSAEVLKIFIQEVEPEMTAALEPAEEEEVDNINFVELHEE